MDERERRTKPSKWKQKVKCKSFSKFFFFKMGLVESEACYKEDVVGWHITNFSECLCVLSLL
jgi:hypothetical protein